MASESRPWQPVADGVGIAPPAGAYSPGVIAGGFVFVSGQVPRDPRSARVIEGGIEEQARQAIENVQAVLAAAGVSLQDVVAMTVYLANEDDWGAFNDVYRSMMRPPYPARAVVGAELRGVLVEISAIAYRGP
jgi:2-iminobutanoate/2-iminopropanoate deaminase